MILPLPRTGPSSRCRLQFTTKIRLSSRSREASVMEPSDSGSSISPSPRNAHTLPPVVCKVWAFLGDGEMDEPEKRPHFAARGLLQPAILEVLDEARVVNRLNGSEAHRNGGKLPEVFHQPGVRIRRQSAARFQFPSEVFQFLFGYAPFEKRAGIHAGGGVSLEVDDVTISLFGPRPQEVVEGNFIEGGRRGKRGNVPANTFLDLVRANDHGQRVPANQTLDAPLHLLAAGEGRLCL